MDLNKSVQVKDAFAAVAIAASGSALSEVIDVSKTGGDATLQLTLTGDGTATVEWVGSNDGVDFMTPAAISEIVTRLHENNRDRRETHLRLCDFRRQVHQTQGYGNRDKRFNNGHGETWGQIMAIQWDNLLAGYGVIKSTSDPTLADCIYGERKVWINTTTNDAWLINGTVISPLPIGLTEADFPFGTANATIARLDTAISDLQNEMQGAVKSTPSSGEHKIDDIRLDGDKKILVKYDEDAEP